jgi:methylenetetrahydrofolate dehydrogenase (NAD+)
LPTEWIQENTTVVNVASFKNVDEVSLLKIPGVVYVPMVGKVTVAMLERNLMRLYENFHSPAAKQQQLQQAPATAQDLSLWRFHAYTAAVVTLLLSLQIMRK